MHPDHASETTLPIRCAPLPLVLVLAPVAVFFVPAFAAGRAGCLGVFPVLGLTLAVIGAHLGAGIPRRAGPGDPS